MLERLMKYMLGIEGTLCKHERENKLATDLEMLRMFFRNMVPLRLLYTTISTLVFGTVLFIKEIPLRIEPYFNKTWTIQPTAISWSDYVYRIPISWSYYIHRAQSNVRAKNYKGHFGGTKRPCTPSVEDSKRALVRLMLASPVVWKIEPVEDTKRATIVMHVNSHLDKTLPQWRYTTKSILFSIEPQDDPCSVSNWDVTVESSDDTLSLEEQMADAVGSILFKIPAGWHSWVHFPYSDFAAAWVNKHETQHNVRGPLYRIMHQHTLVTKYTTTSVKVSIDSLHSVADFSDTTTKFSDDTRNQSSVSAAFPGTANSVMSLIMSDVEENQQWLVHPVLQYMDNHPSAWLHRHPILRIYHRAFHVQRRFVDTIKDEIYPEAVAFAQFIFENTGGQLDHRTDPLGLIVRVLFSAGFVHAVDHNLTAVSGLDLLPVFNPVMRASINKEYYNNASPAERELIDNNVEFNQAVRYPNFLRTFVDYMVTSKQPTMDNIQYNTGSCVIHDATQVYMMELQKQIDGINHIYVKMGLDRHLTHGSLLTSQLPIAINH
jgi:hypothetical protein